MVAPHNHLGRPGVAYIVEGEVTEYWADANGGATTVVRNPDETALEGIGVVHWWKNANGRTACAMVVDIVPAK